MELYDATKPPVGWTEEEARVRMPVPEVLQRAPMCRCSLVPLTAIASERGNVSMEDLASPLSTVEGGRMRGHERHGLA